MYQQMHTGYGIRLPFPIPPSFFSLSPLLLPSLPPSFPCSSSFFSFVVVMVESKPVYMLGKLFTTEQYPQAFTYCKFWDRVLLGCKVHNICLRNCNKPRSMEVVQEGKIFLFQALGMIRSECKSPLGMSFLHGDDFIQYKNTLNIWKTPYLGCCKSTLSVDESSDLCITWKFILSLLGFILVMLWVSAEGNGYVYIESALKAFFMNILDLILLKLITHMPLTALQIQGSSVKRQVHQ